MDLAELVEICFLTPCEPSIPASGASSRGALDTAFESSLLPSRNLSNQITETAICRTCQKQANIPTKKTPRITPFRYLFARNIGSTNPNAMKEPARTRTSTATITVTC